MNCNDSLTTIIKWTINNCTSNCSYQIPIDQTIITTSSELFIPARTLSYGIYQLKLTVSMAITPHLSTMVLTYIEILPSTVIVNLIPFGTSFIIRGYQQNLTLDPGTFSIDPDTTTFNASVSFYSIIKS